MHISLSEKICFKTLVSRNRKLIVNFNNQWTFSGGFKNLTNWVNLNINKKNILLFRLLIESIQINKYIIVMAEEVIGFYSSGMDFVLKIINMTVFLFEFGLKRYIEK